MGYDLSNERGDFRWNIWWWPRVLEYAYKGCGWNPKGTTLSRHSEGKPDEVAEDWSGTYFSNDGQWIDEKDAAALAAALRRGVGDREAFAGYWHKVEDREGLRQELEEFAKYIDGKATVIA